MRRRAFLAGTAAAAAATTGCQGGSDDGPRTEIRNESPNSHEIKIEVGQRNFRGDELTVTVGSGEISWHDDPFWVGDVSTRDLWTNVSVDGQQAFGKELTVGGWVCRFTVTVTGPTDVTVSKFPPRTPFKPTTDETVSDEQ